MSKKIFSGTIVSTKNRNTLIVKVISAKTHKLYGKKYSSLKKYHVHFNDGAFDIGQNVSFVHSKTYSKMKRWEVANGGKS